MCLGLLYPKVDLVVPGKAHGLITDLRRRGARPEGMYHWCWDDRQVGIPPMLKEKARTAWKASIHVLCWHQQYPVDAMHDEHEPEEITASKGAVCRQNRPVVANSHRQVLVAVYGIEDQNMGIGERTTTVRRLNGDGLNGLGTNQKERHRGAGIYPTGNQTVHTGLGIRDWSDPCRGLSGVKGVILTNSSFCETRQKGPPGRLPEI